MRNRHCLWTIVLTIVLANVVRAEDIVYPAAAGIIDITKAPYSADKSGTTDVTAIIQKALDDYVSANRIIYLPNGTYKVSNTLRWGPSATTGCGTCQKRTCLQGQSRDGAIIRLIDNCPGFQDTTTANRKGVIWTGGAPAQRFRNSVMNLTVNTGSGNPGASGVQYYSNNQGSMRSVKIESGDRQGFAGLDVSFSDENGPAFIYDVEVIGFRYGVNAYVLNSMTFQTLRLSEQTVCGFRNFSHVVSVRGLTFTGSVTAVNNDGVMMLMEASLQYTGTSVTAPAVANTGTLYARSIAATGYARAIASTRGSTPSPTGLTVTEFASNPASSQFPSGTTSLMLQTKDPPEIPWDPVADWANPMDFGAVGNGLTDDARAIQAAIDAGKPTVYFPAGKTFTFSTIYIRGEVRRIIGCESSIGPGTIEFQAGTAPAVVFERLDALYNEPVVLRHSSSRSLIVRSVTSVDITGNGTGDLFLEDICTGHFQFDNPAQKIWGWQLNPEDPIYPNIINAGATLWIMGLKTEQAQTKLETTTGGYTELLGAHIYAQGAAKTTPLFVINNASVSFAAVRQISYSNRYFNDYVRETRGDTTRTLTLATAGATLTLYAGYARGAMQSTQKPASYRTPGRGKRAAPHLSSTKGNDARHLSWLDALGRRLGMRADRPWGVVVPLRQQP